MANTLKVKRSSVQGKIPLTSDLQLGELAVNTYDGKLYLKKDVGGVESIVDVSAGLDATGVLQLLKTVDGVGSGLDADLLDGLASSSANTASTIVSRDSSGNFSAGTITAALSGNASTATTLQTARTINGVSFNGSANITIADSTKLPLSGGTMTGAITFTAGQTWPTFNQNTTGSAGSLSSNTDYLVYRSSVADASIDTATQNGIYTRNYTGASASMLVWDAGGSTGTTQLDVNYGNSGAIRLRNKTDNTTWSNWRTFLTDQNYNSYSPTLTGGGASGTWGINVTGNAATVTNGLYSTGSYADPAWITSINYSKLTGTIPTWNQNTTGSAAKWTTARTLSFTGDATGSGSVDGSTNVATALTLANSGVAAGTYTKITVDAKGRATSGTTLATTDIPALDASKITTGVFDPARLPSYVDDVLEYANLAGFPTTGETGKIYVALDTNKTYRWSGTVYVYITSGAVDSVAGKTGVVTLTNADVGLGNVENKSSATIRGEITSTNVTSALGFTPYNSTNPNGYTSNTGTVTSVSGTGTASGLTLSGTVTSTGSLTLSGTVNALAAGTYGISISGNADTATKVVATVTGTNSAELVRGNMADNDQFRILVGATASNSGYVEIATADDGTEPIYVRQYTGVFTSLSRTATLLDASGNTSFPGTITGTTFLGAISGTTASHTSDFTLTGANNLINKNNPAISNTSYSVGNNHIELRTTNASHPSIGFHRSGYTAVTLYHDTNNSLRLRDANTGNDSLIWHSTNDGSGSGLDADLLDGLDLHTGRNNEANKVVRTDGSGYIQAGWINTTSGDNGTTAIDRVYASSDGYIRYYTPANFRQVLDVPTRGGSGASGTWGINITGSAGSAPANGGTATALSSSNYINRTGSSGDLNTDFNNTPAGTFRYHGDDANLTNSPGNTWWLYEHKRHGNSSNYWGTQVAWGWEDNSNRLCTRNVSGGNWSGWVEYLSTSGRSFSGNLTMTGNITASSDERLKTDWQSLNLNFVYELSKVKAGSYLRIDTQERQVGVSAQDIQAILPEAVFEDDKGNLSLAYGNAALVSAVELAKEVVELKAQIAELKALIMEK